MKITQIHRIINSVNQEINSLFQIQIHTPIYPISGMLFMEKNMTQIYREQFSNGSYSVYGEYGINGDLILSDYSYGAVVESFWGNDEYEYYFIVDKDDIQKFVLECLTKGFNNPEKFTISELQKMCDEKGIKYTTDCYV